MYNFKPSMFSIERITTNHLELNTDNYQYSILYNSMRYKETKANIGEYKRRTEGVK